MFVRFVHTVHFQNAIVYAERSEWTSFSLDSLRYMKSEKGALHESVGRFSVELCQNMEYYKSGFRCEEREEKW